MRRATALRDNRRDDDRVGEEDDCDTERDGAPGKHAQQPCVPCADPRHAVNLRRKAGGRIGRLLLIHHRRGRGRPRDKKPVSEEQKPNAAHNGVWLHQSVHKGLHTRLYYRNLNAVFEKYKGVRSPSRLEVDADLKLARYAPCQ